MVATTFMLALSLTIVRTAQVVIESGGSIRLEGGASGSGGGCDCAGQIEAMQATIAQLVANMTQMQVTQATMRSDMETHAAALFSPPPSPSLPPLPPPPPYPPNSLTFPVPGSGDSGSGTLDGPNTITAVGGGGSIMSSATSATYAFTIEAWVNLDTFVAQACDYCLASLFSKGTVYWSFGVAQDGRARYFFYDGSTNYVIDGTAGSVRVGEWAHIAYVNTDQAAGTIFVNGVAEGTGTNVGIAAAGASEALTIGNNGAANGVGEFDGKFSDAKIYEGFSKYTSDFHPPARTSFLG